MRGTFGTRSALTSGVSHRCDFPDLASRRRCRTRLGQDAFTIVEAMIALSVLALFAGSAVYALMSFNDRAARNRNGEAARAILESQVDAMLAQATMPAVTAAGTDLDGDGVGDGVVITSNLPLISQRNSTATGVVTGDLYLAVTQVGTSVGLPNAGDLVSVQYLLQYTYRGRTFTSKLLTFKAAL